MAHLIFDGCIREARDAVLRPGRVRKEPQNPLFSEEFFAPVQRRWEARYDNGYANVLYDEDARLFRCWYTLFLLDTASAGTPAERRPGLSYEKLLRSAKREMGVCYAVSEDGLRWEKPDLGLCMFSGDAHNNIVMRGVHGTGVMRDAREGDPARRYKAFLKMGEYPEAPMGTAFSSHGLRWSPPVPWPEHHAAGDCHNNAFWDERTRRYIGITRLWSDGLRVVGRTESEDFIRWTEPEEVFRGRGPEDQIYSMPVFPHAGIYIGLPSVFCRGDPGDPDYDMVRCELAWSRDTLYWNRICPGTEFIPRGEGRYPDGAYDCGCIYASACPVTQNGETLLYYAGSNGPHTGFREGSFNLARLPEDRFAGYAPLWEDGEAVLYTQSFVCPEGDLQINTEVSAGGFVQAGLAEPDGRPVEGYGLENSSPAERAGAYTAYRWGDRRAGELAGKTLTLEIRLKRAAVYAYQFVSEEQEHGFSR